jgi:cyclic pyranopterin phosphate synthase
MRFSHLDEEGRARMVDVSAKPMVRRTATATGFIRLAPATLDAIRSRSMPKGDVLAAARIAAITAAKRTPELIPLCHGIRLDHVDIRLDSEPEGLRITAGVVCVERTGVEMEALTAVSVAALTIYDMCKAVDRGMVISEIRLVEKTKGVA